MPKQFLGYRRAEGCPQKNQGEDMSNQSYSSGERHVDKAPHSGVETSVSSRISAPTTRPAHIYPQPSSHQSTDHINTYQKPPTSVPAVTHSSMSTVPTILTSTGIMGNNVETFKTSSTSTTAALGHSSPAYPVHRPYLQLATTVGAAENTSANPPISLSANSAFRGGSTSAGGQPTSTTHHTPTFTSHLPRGAAAASALSVPKPGSSISAAAAAAAAMRPSQPSTILSNTSVYSQMNRASLISPIKHAAPATPATAVSRTGQSTMAGVSPTSQIILRSEKPRPSMPIYGDGTTVVTAAPSTQSIQITLKKARNAADVNKSQVMSGHGSAKAVPVSPNITHTSPTTAMTSKMIASQSSLTPLAPNIAIKPGGGKWNSGNHLVDLTKEASKPSKALAVAISMSSQPATTSSGSITQATAASTTVTTSITSIPSSIPIAKVTPQRQQASSHNITQAAAVAAAAAAAAHPIGQESRTESQSHGQQMQTATASNYFIPAQASRVSASSTSLTTSISGGTPTATHSDSRQEGRTAVPHMQSYLQPELIYKMPYPLVYPVTPATAQAIGSVRPGLLPSSTANYPATLPTAAAHCMSLGPTAPTIRLNAMNPMMVTMDALRGQFPVTSQYAPPAAATTTPVITATPESGTISTSVVVTSAADIVSCSPATPVSILSGGGTPLSGGVMQQTPSNLPNSTSTPINNSSPRPSILRKRTNDGAAVGMKKSFGLQSSSSTENTQSPRQESMPQSNTSSPKTPAGPLVYCSDNSQSSTDTALSTEAGSALTPTPGDNRSQMDCLENHEQNGVLPSSLLSTSALPNLQNSVEASPRKKPRKQMLNANEELKDNTSTDEEYDKLDKMDESKDFKTRELKSEVKDEYTDEEGVRWTAEKRRPNLRLINFYSMSWKVRNNHFQRHSDIKSKEDRRSSVNELSNQRGVVQKASGWKLYFLATQLEDMNDMEKVICNQMCKLQKTIAPKASSKQGTLDSDEIRLHELAQANIQRCKLVIDQLSEAHSSMLKILDHKQHILEIINKHISKRPIKKKERT